MRLVRTLWRGGLLAGHLTVGAAAAAWSRRGLDERFTRGWCRVACAIVGLRVRRTGTLAAAAGTLFLRRGSPRASARAVSCAVERLAEGRSVAVFPEGTSTAGETVLAFKASLFEAAARLGCGVQPVSVSYPRTPGRPAVAPFVGADEFVPHLLRVLAEPWVDVELNYAPALSGHGRTRGELAHASRAAVLLGMRGEDSFRGCLVATPVSG